MRVPRCCRGLTGGLSARPGTVEDVNHGRRAGLHCGNCRRRLHAVSTRRVLQVRLRLRRLDLLWSESGVSCQWPSVIAVILRKEACVRTSFDVVTGC